MINEKTMFLAECDGCGCELLRVEPCSTGSELDSLLYRAGWVHVHYDKKDYCDKCVLKRFRFYDQNRKRADRMEEDETIEWPDGASEIYTEALAKLSEYNSGTTHPRMLCDAPLLYGPAHVVWADQNWDKVDWCLEHFDEFRGDYSDEELAIVCESLVRLRTLLDEEG